MESTLIAGTGTRRFSRGDLTVLETPESTRTHQVIPHIDLVKAVIEALSYRHISVVSDDYAVSEDGMKMFGILDLDLGFEGCRFSLGIRNAHDKSMRLALTVGYRVFVCSNMAFHGDFQPVMAKHTKNFRLLDALAIGIDAMQRNFQPMQTQVERWKGDIIPDTLAKLIIYKAFTEGQLEAPRHLDRVVHEHYFNPKYDEFLPRTMWSLTNSFTSAFKELEPVPQFKATARLGDFFSDN
jgi:hypothetical protein